MKIVKQTPSILVIESKNILFKLVAAAFLLAGGTFAALILLPFQIECTEKAPGSASQCTVYQRYVKPYTRQDMPELKKAEAVFKPGSRNIRNYNLKLRGDGRTIVVGMPGPGYEKTTEAAQSINRYIAESSNLRFTIPLFYPWYLQGFVLIFPTVGLVLLLWAGTSRFSFRKNQGVLLAEQKSVLFNSRDKYPLSSIRSIEIEEMPGDKGKPVYRLVCKLDNGDTVPFNIAYDSFYQSKANMQKAISEFLDLEQPSLRGE